MSSYTSIVDILKDLPGWEGASVEELEGGLSNSSYLLQKGDSKAVLKVDHALRDAPLNSREQEARVQRAANAEGLAGDVLFVSERLILTEYVEAPVWTSDDLLQKENLANLAQTLKRVHALPLTGRTLNALEAARIYIRELHNREADPIMTKQCLETIRRFRAPPNVCCCHNDLETIRRFRAPPNVCCCHNDLVVANIVGSSEIRFLDWEYACDNDPFFDLATVVAHHRLEPALADYFLDAYFEGDGARWRSQLERQQELYDALAWLWEATRS